MLAPRPTPTMKAHPESAVRDFSFNTFTATLRRLHSQVEDAPCRGASHSLVVEIKIATEELTFYGLTFTLSFLISRQF